MKLATHASLARLKGLALRLARLCDAATDDPRELRRVLDEMEAEIAAARVQAGLTVPCGHHDPALGVCGHPRPCPRHGGSDAR